MNLYQQAVQKEVLDNLKLRKKLYGSSNKKLEQRAKQINQKLLDAEYEIAKLVTEGQLIDIILMQENRKQTWLQRIIYG